MSTMTAADPVVSIAALTAMIRDECRDVDRTRALPDSVVDALRQHRVFHLLATREVGGAELDPPTFLRLVEAAAYADGSVGWCVMIGGCYATIAGLLPAQGADEIFGDGSTIAAGAFRPSGVAERVPGGYRVSGRWQLASGSTHATWYIAGCTITTGGQPQLAASGMPVMREVFFPASSVELIDTWQSTGLRGTASHDYTVTDLFVPEHRTMWFQEPPQCNRPLYRMPPIATFGTYIGAVSIGIARHAVDAFAELAAEKTPALSADRLADKPTAQAALGHAHATVVAGRAHLLGALSGLWERVTAGHAPTFADRGALWLAATHVSQTCLDAVGRLYAAAGASSVYADCALDRCLRDARTAAQHVCAQQSNYELAGRQLLGRSDRPSVWMLDYRGEG
jgi:alkylation response protein AidB-like acyl-CoA dehydrogenase